MDNLIFDISPTRKPFASTPTGLDISLVILLTQTRSSYTMKTSSRKAQPYDSLP